MKHKGVNIVILFITMILVLFFTLKDDFWGIVDSLKNVNIFLFLLSVFLLFISLFFKSLSLKGFLNKYDKNYGVIKTYKLTLIGQFLNGITPFQTGGQPFQIYLLKKDGIRLSDSTSAMLNDFVAYQVSLIVVGVLSLLINIKLNVFSDNFYLNMLIMFGFLINLIVLSFLLSIIFLRKTSKKILTKMINFFFKFKIINKISSKEKAVESLDKFYKNTMDIKNDKTSLLKGIIFNIISFIILYSIPFTLFNALGNHTVDLVGTTITVALVMIIGNFIPIPGATGGIEYSFMQFFSKVSSGAELSSVMILWRVVTYLIPVVVGFMVLSLKKEVKKRCE